jgi:hypothetical protein
MRRNPDVGDSVPLARQIRGRRNARGPDPTGFPQPVGSHGNRGTQPSSRRRQRAILSWALCPLGSRGFLWYNLRRGGILESEPPHHRTGGRP